MNGIVNAPKKIYFKNDEIIFLCLITIIGAVIRFGYQYDRSYIGDEVGTIIWMERDVLYLLTHFTTWLTMNYFIVLEKYIAALSGNGPLVLGFIPLMAGIATIPLTACLASRYTTSKIAIISSAFVAVNPYLVMYSGFIRSYSLLVAFSVLALILFFEYCGSPSLKTGIKVSVVCFIMTLFHPNGSYTIAFIWVIIALKAVRNFKKHFIVNLLFTIILPLSVSMLLIYFSYIGIFPEMFKDGRKWHNTPPTSIAYIPFLFEAYFTASWFRLISIFFFSAGILISFFKKKPLFLLSLYIILPILCMSAQGLSHYPWGYARFLIPCVPVILIFIGEGLVFCSNLVFQGRYQASATILMTFIIILTWMPNMQKNFNEKIPVKESEWYKAANFLITRYKNGDLILCDDWFMQLYLQTYLSKSQYMIEPLKKYIDSSSFDSSEGEAFLITSSNFKTFHASNNLGRYQIISYPLYSKNQILTLLRADYLQTAKSLESTSDTGTAMVYACLIGKYLKVEDDSSCEFVRQKKIQTNWSGKRMPSLWKKK